MLIWFRRCLAGGKVIISTGTKTLQDQLFNRDIPTVRAALKAPVTVALLKGRANYVCHYHLERTIQDERASFASREEVKYLKLIERYAGVSKSGDKSGLSEVPENAAVWQQVTSTRDNCLGSECAALQKLFCHGGAQASAFCGCSRRQPPSVFC